MKKSRIKPLSNKKKEVLEREAIQVKLLLEACKGLCMECGQKPDFRGLQKSHTRGRKRFILVCSECHSPDGKHQYLNDKEVNNG